MYPHQNTHGTIVACGQPNVIENDDFYRVNRYGAS
jgi:hypothetical protein